MTLRKICCLVAALPLVPAVAAADDLSSTLSGGGGSGSGIAATYDSVSSGSGQGTKIEETGDTGLIELVVKVLDACVDPFNRYWVFAGGLTDVEVELTVRDSATGLVSEYGSPQQTPFQPIQDTDAFATCDVN